MKLKQMYCMGGKINQKWIIPGLTNPGVIFIEILNLSPQGPVQDSLVENFMEISFVDVRFSGT